jgi:hypothetical protein
MRRWAPHLASVALLVGVSAFCLLAVEIGYRYFLSRTITLPEQYQPKVAENPTFNFFGVPAPWRFSADAGFDFVEGRWMYGQIENGTFSNCRFYGEGNALTGYGAIKQDWETADVRVLLLGSSFTLVWGTEEGTSEQLRQGLERLWGRKVALLNLSRDATGVLTMFDIAASRMPKLRPDLVLFAFNTTAFDYGRHWRTLRPLDSESLVLYLLRDPLDRVDRRRALPQPYVITPRATGEWCEGMQAAKEAGNGRKLREDPVLIQMIAEHKRYARELAPPPLALDLYRYDRSFVYNRIIHNDPYFGLKLIDEVSIFTPLSIHDYRMDPAFFSALAAVKASKVPFLLLHIPARSEMDDSHLINFGEGAVPADTERDLAKSLEAATAHTIIHLWPAYPSDLRANPATLVISEKDNHPSRLGAKALASAMVRVISDRYDPEKK